ncbi:MAG TPA: DHA2 family efflux MFS transporter permease subunit [Solirubrobacterales bacterium]|nr:DHA2 family efflux MFS transporter permease subunit [Solirubrobacterales bacterium]
MQSRPEQNLDRLDRQTLTVCGVALLGVFMAAFDATSVNVALDRLARDFATPFTTIQWAVTAYTLALATVIPAAGWATERFGEKRLYLCSLAAFTAGSALCAAAWSPASLIAFRCLQGFGGGLMLPCVTTIITRKAGIRRRGRVMGILGVPLLLAPVFGPIIGGVLIDGSSWRTIFLINLPIGLLAIFLARTLLEPSEPQRAKPLDWLGLALLSPGLVLLIFGLAETPAHGLSQARTWLPMAAGTLLIALFLVHSWRAAEPLIDVKTFFRRRAGAAAGIVFLLVVAMTGTELLTLLYFQIVRGASASASGLLLAPRGIGVMIALPLAGWTVDRRTARSAWLPFWSVPLMLIGFAPFAFVTASTPIAVLCGFSLLAGFAMGLSFSPTMTAALASVPERAAARTITALDTLDQVAVSICVAAVSVLLASAGAVTHGTTKTAGLGESGISRNPEALAAAFASIFSWILLVLALVAIPALALARGRNRPSDSGRSPGWGEDSAAAHPSHSPKTTPASQEVR